MQKDYLKKYEAMLTCYGLLYLTHNQFRIVLYFFLEMKQMKLFLRVAHYYDYYCLNLENVTYLGRCALQIDYGEGCYLIARYKGQDHVFYGTRK